MRRVLCFLLCPILFFPTQANADGHVNKLVFPKTSTVCSISLKENSLSKKVTFLHTKKKKAYIEVHNTSAYPLHVQMIIDGYHIPRETYLDMDIEPQECIQRTYPLEEDYVVSILLTSRRKDRQSCFSLLGPTYQTGASGYIRITTEKNEKALPAKDFELN